MRDVQHRSALGDEPVDEEERILARLRIQHGGRLVEGDAADAHGQHAGDRETLLLSDGEEMGGSLLQLGEVYGGQSRVYAFLYLRSWQTEVLGPESHVLLDRRRDYLIERRLDYEADCLVRVAPADFVRCGAAVDQNPARARSEEAVQQSQQAAFARSVLADDRQVFAPLDAQGEIRYGWRTRVGV